ncbi:MAG: hypothetical protein K2X48_00305 [Chitinophagaceae bacterium]|nr:hypothetical protein [Chitinophagaceae bacterium]
MEPKDKKEMTSGSEQNHLHKPAPEPEEPKGIAKEDTDIIPGEEEEFETPPYENPEPGEGP